jgi:hypothetical protein
LYGQLRLRTARSGSLCQIRVQVEAVTGQAAAMILLSGFISQCLLEVV